eukprot:1159462-Pelagomonas_calceolata.AAC.10
MAHLFSKSASRSTSSTISRVKLQSNSCKKVKMGSGLLQQPGISQNFHLVNIICDAVEYAY